MPEYTPLRRIPGKQPDRTPAPPSAPPTARPKPTPKERRNTRQLEAVHQAAELLRQLQRNDKAVEDLKSFLIMSWPVVNPGVPFVDNWHIDCLCEHLTALYRREIRRLIINIPPRSYKSGLVSVQFPAWVWLQAPHEKFLCASYGRQIALRDSRKCRNLIASQFYQVRWGDRYQLAADQNEKGRFENNRGGARVIASVEGGALGEGGNFRIYDDPNDLNKMVSEPETYPQSVREWYSGTISSRNIDPKTDVALCVQQRSSYGSDLTEYLLELGGWDQIVIPNEYDGRKTIGPLAFPDPRTHVGELMFPARLGPEETEILKREQRQHYPAQFNQIPSLSGKSGLKKEWFNFWTPRGTLLKDVTADGTEKVRPIRISLADGSFVEKVPVELPVAFEQLCHSLDCAFKGNEDNDYVADHVWGRIGANTYLLHREHGHWNFPETLQMVRRLSQQYPCPEKLVEDKANGPAVVQTLINEIPGLIAVNPEGGKWSRVAAISGYVEAGNVYLPSPDLFPWVWELLAEFAAGQSARHDDDTDAMTQALKRLFDAQAQAGLPEFRIEPRVGMGEPATARHVEEFVNRPDWRKFIALIPNRAAVWVAETPSHSLRIYRELDIERLDAAEVGRKIVEMSLPDLSMRPLTIDSIRRPQSQYANAFEIYLPKTAFVEIEPVGCWAELMEQAIFTYGDTDGTDTGRAVRQTIKDARFRCELVEEELTTALDRLRGLLAFAPPTWSPVDYDRAFALALAQKDLAEYHRYMGMVEGKVIGEWPKLKIHPSCPQIISQMGTVRRDKLDELPAFVEALLLGVSAPKRNPERQVVEKPYIIGGGTNLKNQRLLGRKFAMR